jgi:hypothetical protein
VAAEDGLLDTARELLATEGKESQATQCAHYLPYFKAQLCIFIEQAARAGNMQELEHGLQLAQDNDIVHVPITPSMAAAYDTASSQGRDGTCALFGKLGMPHERETNAPISRYYSLHGPKHSPSTLADAVLTPAHSAMLHRSLHFCSTLLTCRDHVDPSKGAGPVQPTVQQHLAAQHPLETLGQAVRRGQWDVVSMMLLSFDRTAKARACELMHLNLVIELAVKQDQLFAAYLAMYHCIRTDTQTLVHPHLQELLGSVVRSRRLPEVRRRAPAFHCRPAVVSQRQGAAPTGGAGMLDSMSGVFKVAIVIAVAAFMLEGIIGSTAGP